MWVELLNDIHNNRIMNGDLSYLNFKFELHIAIYIIELLKDIITFKIKDKSLKMTLENKSITFDKFFYWWQIERTKQLTNEEKELIQKYETIQKTIIKYSNNINKLKSTPDSDKKDDNESQIESFETKINKLQSHLKKETPLLKQKLTLIGNFKNSYQSKESLKQLLNSIEFYLKNN